MKLSEYKLLLFFYKLQRVTETTTKKQGYLMYNYIYNKRIIKELFNTFEFQLCLLNYYFIKILDEIKKPFIKLLKRIIK